MKTPLKRILYWSPRILGILFALFISLFALDVFGEGYSFWETAVALFMHLIPVYILVAALALAWRWEWIGVLVFGAFGIWYLANNWYPAAISANLAIAAPALLTALLFLSDWLYDWQHKNSVLHT